VFLASSNPKYYAISKCLYCLQSLRGTFDALSFWLVDVHARMLASSLYNSCVPRYGTESQTSESLMLGSIDNFMSPQFHVEEVGVGVDGNSVSISNRNQKSGSGYVRPSNDISSSVCSRENMSSISSGEMFSIDPNYGFIKP
jgi:hypothetical protein